MLRELTWPPGDRDWPVYIQGSCSRGFDNTCTVTADCRAIPLTVVKSLIPHESRRLSGGRNKIEMSLLYVGCFVWWTSSKESGVKD